MNTLTGGARLGKFYLFSGSTGVGKTRTMLSHMVYLATPEYFDQETGEWVCKEPLPSLFISTELNNDELTSMALAFISGIDENKILGRDPMTFDESSILKHAADVLKESPLYYEVLTDFTVSDIERTIKLNIDKNDIMYCAFDYISTSTSLLAEMSKKAHGVSLREDSILLLLSTKLKDIANEYGVFIESATQLNRTGVGADDWSNKDDNGLEAFVNLHVGSQKEGTKEIRGLMVIYRDWETDRKSTRLNSSHRSLSRMPSSA